MIASHIASHITFLRNIVHLYCNYITVFRLKYQCYSDRQATNSIYWFHKIMIKHYIIISAKANKFLITVQILSFHKLIQVISTFLSLLYFLGGLSEFWLKKWMCYSIYIIFKYIWYYKGYQNRFRERNQMNLQKRLILILVNRQKVG